MRLPRNLKMLRGPVDPSALAGTLFVLWIATLVHSSLVLPPGVRLRLADAAGLLGESLPDLSVAVDPGDPQRVFLGTEVGTVLRSSDGGILWDEVELLPRVQENRVFQPARPPGPVVAPASCGPRRAPGIAGQSLDARRRKGIDTTCLPS